MQKRRVRVGQLSKMSFAVLVACSLSTLAATPEDSAPGPVKSEQVKKQGEQPGHEAVGAFEAQQTVKADPTQKTDVALLKEQFAQQQKEIDWLRRALQEQKELLERFLESAHAAQPSYGPTAQNAGLAQVASLMPVIPAAPSSQPPPGVVAQAPNLGQVASLVPVIPVAPKAAAISSVATSYPALSPAPDPAKAPVTQDEMKGYTQKVDSLESTVKTLNKGIAGFKFSGDLRYRFDGIWRSASSVASSQQNVRERYRLRFNVDKAVTDQLDFHLQLGSGTFNNPLTFDTDFAGVNNRGPLFVTEYYGAYHPSKHIDVRGGKLQEVFADNSRFMFDDDLRLSGFQESLKVGSVELRAGQYVLTNPNVQVLPSAKACTPPPPQVITTLPATITTPPALPANCAYLSAGFPPGGKVRDTNLFDQGIAFLSNIQERWSHQLFANVQLWRNPNAIQLGSTAAGLPILVNGYYGVTVSSPAPGTGNATTTKGGAIYTAPNFQFGRVAYRLTYTGFKTSHQNVPVWLELQGGRNFGTSFARNAWMGTFNIGEVKKFGDIRFLYTYAYKDVNSMIAEVTDDDLGTTTGVNIRTHGIRVDAGINKFLEWDNKFWIQDPVRGNDPARKLFVPVPAGTNTSYRIQSEFLFKF